MAYLKLMMDEKEIAHLSEDGQSLCANEGVPQYNLPLNLFIGEKREVPLVDVVVWAKKRIFPKNRIDCKEILKLKAVVLYILDKSGEMDFIHLFNILYFAERKQYAEYGQHLVHDSFTITNPKLRWIQKPTRLES